MRWRLCCRDAPVGFKSSTKLFLAALFSSVERAEDKKGKGALTGGEGVTHPHATLSAWSWRIGLTCRDITSTSPPGHSRI